MPPINYTPIYVIKEMAPIIYTPTVAWACKNFSHLYRRPRGMYFSANDRGEMASMVYNWPRLVRSIYLSIYLYIYISIFYPYIYYLSLRSHDHIPSINWLIYSFMYLSIYDAMKTDLMGILTNYRVV